ncbi:cation diffusion facilitator family transporter [Chitinophaga sp. GCM10012297]|uniref:Cation transporter n=1 Tax=Chitinophaga chungangae TaxID=2821488 RepID=A0ABS3Y7N6_9BACT|nr:cation diffusion facilitator family transporter [Chitinophaga chungangae]MBO9150690.1 cation transporter [Chitinophaga chungangae]
MHDHAHAPLGASRLNRAFLAGIGLNLTFVVVEAVAGFSTGSLALLSDAGHNLSDVASLALSMLAFRLARVPPGPKYTYGYRKSTILISLLNAIILLIAVGAIGYEAIGRLRHPVPLSGGPVASVAGIGIVINTISAFLFFRDKETDLNVKGAYLHLMADALVSLGTVGAGLLMLYTQQYWIDAAVSIVVMAVIVYGTWDLLRDSLRLSLDGVPSGISVAQVQKAAVAVPGVKDLHHVHIWAVSTTENALTAHVTVQSGLTDEQVAAVKKELKHALHHLNISHCTLETELSHTDEDAGF